MDRLIPGLGDLDEDEPYCVIGCVAGVMASASDVEGANRDARSA
jgi:hypothetical protein